MERLKEEEEGNYCIALLALNLMITFFDLPALQRKQRSITREKSTTTTISLPTIRLLGQQLYVLRPQLVNFGHAQESHAELNLSAHQVDGLDDPLGPVG